MLVDNALSQASHSLHPEFSQREEEISGVASSPHEDQSYGIKIPLL